MNYFKLNIKKMAKSKIIIATIILLIIVMIADPISAYFQAIQLGRFHTVGNNALIYWLLMNSAGWGEQVYATLFLILPVLLTGLVLYDDLKCSVYPNLIVRGTRYKYFVSSSISAFFISFISIFIPLAVNTLITNIIFGHSDTQTEYYQSIIPAIGTFARDLFDISPFLMEWVYVFLNAIAIALLSVFAVAIHIILPLKNRYIALIIPVVIFYVITFIFDAIPLLFHYNLRLIVQPTASWALSELLNIRDMITTYSIWTVVDIVLLFIGIIRRRDIL